MALLARPRLRLLKQLNTAIGPGDVGARRLRVQCLRQDFVLQGEDHLDQAEDTRGRLRMTDVGFAGAQPERPLVPAWRRKHLDQGARLNGITQHRSRAVSLEGIDVVREKSAASSAVRTRRAWLGPLGAVIPWLCPS